MGIPGQGLAPERISDPMSVSILSASVLPNENICGIHRSFHLREDSLTAVGVALPSQAVLINPGRRRILHVIANATRPHTEDLYQSLARSRSQHLLTQADIMTTTAKVLQRISASGV